ncbi:MAG: adenylate/guanylate cyclase domain-containing protein, partial [Pseudomonadota bacterium]
VYFPLSTYFGWHRYSANCALAVAIAYIILLYLANGLLTVEVSVNVSASSRDHGATEWLDGVLVTQNLVSSLTPAQAAWAFWPLQLVLIAFSVSLCVTRKGPALVAFGVALAAVLILYQGSKDLSLMRFGLFSVFALFVVASAVQLVGALFERHQLADAFEQFVPPEVARQVADDPSALQHAETVRELTVLFCDMKGFTGIAEQLTPSQMTGLLNRYFDVVTRVVIRHRGTIDKYMGDAVMAFWGAPVSTRDHASQAVQAARDIQQEMQTLARDFQLVQLPPIHVGIGVSTGESFVGHLGSDHRKANTVIGDSVNVAQRLERATREFAVDVIVSEATVERDRATAFRELGTIRLKGRERALRVYQPVCKRDQLSQSLKDELAQHEQAMALLRTKQWSAARPVVTQLAEISTETALYNTYLAQITDATRPSRTGSDSDLPL